MKNSLYLIILSFCIILPIRSAEEAEAHVLRPHADVTIEIINLPQMPISQVVINPEQLIDHLVNQGVKTGVGNPEHEKFVAKTQRTIGHSEVKGEHFYLTVGQISSKMRITQLNGKFTLFNGNRVPHYTNLVPEPYISYLVYHMQVDYRWVEDINISIVPSYIVIDHISTAEAHRRQGRATRLVEEFMGILERSKILCDITTSARNDASEALFNKLHFSKYQHGQVKEKFYPRDMNFVKYAVPVMQGVPSPVSSSSASASASG